MIRPASAAPLAATLAAKKYERKIGKGHNLGMPHAHVCIETIESIHESETSPDPLKPLSTALNEALESESQLQLAVLFPHWRVQECYKKDVQESQAKFSMSVKFLCDLGITGLTTGDTYNDIIKALAHRFERKAGTPPRHNVERTVKHHLHKMQNKKRG